MRKFRNVIIEIIAWICAFLIILGAYRTIKLMINQ